MRTSNLFRRLAAGALVAALATGGVALTGVAANAAPPPGTLGSLTITPTSGSDLTIQTAQTSGACPSDGSVDSGQALVTGPIGAATPTFPAANPFPFVTTSTAAFSTTGPFSLTFGRNFKDAATSRGTTVQAGEYDVTVKCVAGFTGTVNGTFTGAIFFTSPTAFQTTDPSATTTTLTTSPASPATFGDPVTLNATVTSTAAGGTVQFKNGTANLGTPVTVPANGTTASSTTTSLPVGTNSLTATFTPASSTINPSTSAAVSYVVNSVVVQSTTTTLSVTPAGPVAFGSPVTLNTAVTPATAIGSVQFKDGTANIGPAQAVSGGTASFSTSSLAAGAHSLTASFVPADPARFSPSSSTPAQSLTVNAFTGSSATENITTTVAGGSLVISVNPNPAVILPTPVLAADGSLLTTSGRINPVTVVDTRSGNPGWTASGQVADFSDGSTHFINSGNLGWVPNLIDKGTSQTVTAGGAVNPAAAIAPGVPAPAGQGLATSRTLASAAPGAGIGTAHLDALLNLNVPTTTVAGTYTAVLTLTAI